MRTLLILLLLSGISQTYAEETISADRLIYREVVEGDSTPQFNRILVTSDHVRFDDGSGTDAFLLYDRKKRVIYSVSREERSILEIAPKPVNDTDAKAPKVEVRKKRDEQAPRIGGAKPIQVELAANGNSCEKRLVVPELMKRAMTGLIEYHRTLAWQQQASIGAIPAAMQSACELALNVYHVDLLLREGLSFQRWGQGRREELVDFAEGEKHDARLFMLPDGFRRRAM